MKSRPQSVLNREVAFYTYISTLIHYTMCKYCDSHDDV